MDDEKTLEMAEKVTNQSTAQVQCAIGAFWERNGEPTEQLLSMLRQRLNGAVETTLREFFGGSAGLE